MMTSSNGNIFRVTGRLCGEFPGHWWIPRTKASDTELWCFLWFVWINGWENNRDLRRYRAHYDVIVMCHSAKRNGSNGELYKFIFPRYCSDVIMSVKASQITSVTIVWSTVFSGADQRKQQSSVSLAFARGFHRWPVDSLHKGPVTRKMSQFDGADVFNLISPSWGIEMNIYACLLSTRLMKIIFKKNLDDGCIVCIYFFVFSTEIEFVQYEYFFYNISIAWQEMVR